MQSFLNSYLGDGQLYTLEPLPKAGSDRAYFRVFHNGQTYIVCESQHVKENEVFFYFTDFFYKRGLPVSRILHINPDRTRYLLQDLGSKCLLDLMLNEGYTDHTKSLYEKSIEALVKMQTTAGNDLDYTKCLSAQKFNSQAIINDLQYFKYYFLDLQSFVYDKAALQEEFEMISQKLGSVAPLTFMFRDFQGRNIMIKEDQPFFIDYQGGMQGPPQYDIASLLWQAKAMLPMTWKQELYVYFKQQLKANIDFEESSFDQHYAGILLLRLLQVMGAYGLRGLIEKKPHFISSIAHGLENIKQWLSMYSLNEYPVLMGLLAQMTEHDFIAKFQTKQAASGHVLKVKVQSFSYKKGIPDDPSGNGGGFVFDCRGILNPGRFEPYKKLTGRDKPVIDFLEANTRMQEFIQQATQLVDISLDDYLARGFEHLMISFGCTGGQHRSVYSADAMAKHIRTKYGLEVEVNHIEQEAKGWVNG